jgi:hypothetical protein
MKRSYISPNLPEKLSGQGYQKIAHGVWAIGDEDGMPVAVRKHGEPEQIEKISMNPYRMDPQIGDSIVIIFGGEKVACRVAERDGDMLTVFSKSGAKLDNVHTSWIVSAQVTPPGAPEQPRKDPNRPDRVDKPAFDPQQHVMIQDQPQLNEQSSALAQQLNQLLEQRGGRVAMHKGPFLIVFERAGQGGLKRAVYRLTPQSQGVLSYTSVEQMVDAEGLTELMPEVPMSVADAILGAK